MSEEEKKTGSLSRLSGLKRWFRFPESTNYYPLIFTIIFVVILFQYSFAGFEAIFYDFRVKYDLGISDDNDIVVVYIDEESDEFLGEKYPYNYLSHYKMLERLIGDKPKIINFLDNLREPDDQNEERTLFQIRDLIQEYVREGGHFRFSSAYFEDWGKVQPPLDLRSIGYSFVHPLIDSFVFSKDELIRRTLLSFEGEESLELWTANTWRRTKGLAPLTLKSINGSQYDKKADMTYVLFRYPFNPTEQADKVRSIPFHRVRVGNFPKGFFKDKIVLVGSKYISNSSDYFSTPFNKGSDTEGISGREKDRKIAPFLNIQAATIQALIKNKTVTPISRNVSHVICIFISLFLSVTISRIKPSDGLLITLLLMVFIILGSYLIFVTGGYWLYISHIIITIFVVYYIWVPFRAIGEYQRRYAIQEETKLLKKVENLKQNFISLMSHDLKTPVAKIAGLADIMKQKSTDPEQLKNFTSIIDSTKELNGFITSILDLTKIESRNLDLNFVSRDINKVIEAIVKGLAYQANQKNIEVVQDLGPLYPIQVDPTLINRVISNLVENAIKYSGENTRVEVKTWDDENWVYLTVSDNGAGIPETELEYIFEKFYRVKNDASHSIKGTGLGLYLVKYFIELHGGEISVESELGKGTSFLVKLKNE
ncbi:MAG: ATP-binding protein [Bacteriovoracaceae bacterium]